MKEWIFRLFSEMSSLQTSYWMTNGMQSYQTLGWPDWDLQMV
uniref:Uncharacterized protein n=1 Tax=Populus trichocarpa x Populus deltoides TaxID=3695 RepID=A9PIY7_9ROSI|nr:unknown [Populus trichocarpa x Populus deltoides]